MDDNKLRVGSPVIVIGKNLEGTVAFIGTTQFSTGSHFQQYYFVRKMGWCRTKRTTREKQWYRAGQALL